MGNKKTSAAVCDGNIDTSVIYDVHRQIKEIVESYKEVNIRVTAITAEVNENWVGKGHNEFQSQYNLLIKKIDDFGDTLKDIYDALVEAEASYEDTDDDIRQDFAMAISS
ncbi:MAG: WXG100 family type VII secretion target [Blautia sp.]|nr:WXG100 family type VII secretion target [Blautia sp.]